jgi:hypothetical protein
MTALEAAGDMPCTGSQGLQAKHVPEKSLASCRKRRDMSYIPVSNGPQHKDIVIKATPSLTTTTNREPKRSRRSLLPSSTVHPARVSGAYVYNPSSRATCYSCHCSYGMASGSDKLSCGIIRHSCSEAKQCRHLCLLTQHSGCSSYSCCQATT